MKHPIEISTSGKNQACTPHRSKVTYNLNSLSCCMLFNRALMHVKIKINKSILKLVYNFWLLAE